MEFDFSMFDNYLWEDAVNLTVLTWNMDHWKRTNEQRNTAWKYLTENISFDVALLQECVPPHEINDLNNVIYREIGGRRNWGSAIVTLNLPVRELELKNSYPGALVAAEVTLPDDTVITAISLYGMIDSDGYATLTIHRMLSDLTPLLHKERSKRLFVIGGDLNVSLQWDEQYNNRDPAHKIVFDRLEDLGLINCTYQYYQGHIQTNRHPRSSVPWQNDYIFASKKISNKLVSCHVIENEIIREASDHNPVVTTFNI